MPPWPDEPLLRLLWAHDKRMTQADSGHVAIGAPCRIWLIHDGWTWTTSEGRELRAGAGHLVFLPSGSCIQRFSDGAGLRSLAFTATWPDGRSLLAEVEPFTLPAERAGALLASMDELVRFPDENESLYAWSQRQVAWLRCWNAVIALVQCHGGRFTEPQAIDDRIRRLRKLLDTWPLDRPLRRSVCERSCDLGWRRLEQLARRDLGATPHHLLEQRRFQAAQELLGDRSQPLKAIATRLAFSSADAFAAWFRRRCGIGPRAWRSRSGSAV